jgi:hypothetical protein
MPEIVLQQFAQALAVGKIKVIHQWLANQFRTGCC